MNDERIINELSRIRMKMHVLWLMLPILSFGIRAINGSDWTLWDLLPEIVLFTATAVSLVVSMIRRNEASMIDERTIDASYTVVRTSFYWIIGSVIATHFLRMVVGSQAALYSGVTVSVFLSITFYAYYFFSIRKGIYFNYEAMESTNGDYWRNVLRRIGVMILFFAGLFFVYWLVSLIHPSSLSPKVIALSMTGSMILLIGQYAVLSLLERIHFREAREVEAGRVRLFHKIAVVIMISLAVFSLFRGLTASLVQYLFVTNRQTTDLAVALQFVSIFLLIASFDWFAFHILELIFLKKHLKLAYPALKRWLSIGLFALVFLGAAGLIVSLAMQYLQLFFRSNETPLQSIQILSMSSLWMSWIGLSIHIALMIYLLKKGHRFVIFKAIAILISLLLPSLYAPYSLSKPLLVFVLHSIILTIATVLQIVYAVSGGRTFVLSPPEAVDLEQTKADAV